MRNDAGALPVSFPALLTGQQSARVGRNGVAARIRFTRHAREGMVERGIPPAWVARTLEAPAWTRPDPDDPALTRSFAPIPEAGGRILRVVWRPEGEDSLVVTTFLDRGAKP